MPRLRPSIFWKAHRISPPLAALLPVCRDIGSALNELRWIREHVRDKGGGTRTALGREWRVAELCRRRGRGEPLQYLLGTQPFGELDIICRRGVLIPRTETEAYTVRLAELIRTGKLQVGQSRSAGHRLRVLDLCTGTGCIPLLLYSRLRRSFPDPGQLEVLGVDVSARAVSLARENTSFNFPRARRSGEEDGEAGVGSRGGARHAHAQPRFVRVDIFSDPEMSVSLTATRGGSGSSTWDVLTCNPPYVSEAGFARDTARSVRIFEPKRANVPDLAAVSLPSAEIHYGRGQEPVQRRNEDVFYARVLDLVSSAGSGGGGAVLSRTPKVVLFEVGDLAQAMRVAEMALLRPPVSARLESVEIWRDWPDELPEEGEEAQVDVAGAWVPVRGSGHGRAVLIQYQCE